MKVHADNCVCCDLLPRRSRMVLMKGGTSTTPQASAFMGMLLALLGHKTAAAATAGCSVGVALDHKC